MKIEWKSCFRAGVTILIIIVCVMMLPKIGNLLGMLLSAAMPLVIGFIIAYLLNILMSKYEKLYFPKAKKKLLIKSRRPVCLILSMVTLIAIVTLVIALVIPQFAACVSLLFEKIPGVIESVAVKLEEWNLLADDVVNYLNGIDWQARFEQFAEVLTSGIGNAMGTVISTVSSIFGGIMTAVIAIIFSVYMLSGKERILRQCRKLLYRYVPQKAVDKITHVLSAANECFQKYIVGQCVEAVILGALCTLGMWILKLPYAPMIGALIALTALIPVAGAYIGAFVGAVMILTVSPLKAVIFLVFLVLLQQFEGNIIYPRVVGSSIGLPGIWVLAAVTIGGSMMGIAGMLIGVPITATVYRLLKEDVNRAAATPAEVKGENHVVKPQSN